MLTFRQYLREEIINPENSLGLSRTEMPQIRSFDVPDYLEWLVKQGVDHESQSVPASSLKPCQKEIDGEKARAMTEDGSGKPLMVSADGYILDGHHRWMNAVWDDKDLKIIRIPLNIKPLLELTRKYPRVMYVGVDHTCTPFIAA